MVGLTGGIGSGKTTVSECFRTFGATLIDADEVSRALTAAHAAGSRAVADAFGPYVLDSAGALDRAAMRRLIFTDANARKRLESILHPIIRAEMLRQLSAVPPTAPYVLWIVPLLVEHRAAHHHCHRLLVVDCDEALQIARVQARGGLTQDEATAMLKAQTARTTRVAAADDVLPNNGTREEIAPKVQKLDTMYRMLSASMLREA